MKKDMEKMRTLAELEMIYWCTDDPELKALTLKYNAEASEEAVKIHDECVIIDGCTFYVETYNWQLQQSKATALNFTVPDCSDPSGGGAVWQLANYLHVIDKAPEYFLNVLTTDDIYKAKETGKIGVILGSQSCDFMLHGELEMVVELFGRMGLRISQIAYNHRSFAADGCLSGTDAGITKHGRRLVRAMEKSGITLDLSHVGRASTLDAMEYAEKPMIFSHSNPKALFDVPRNINDEQIKMCAAHGGVIGACAFPMTLWDGKNIASIDRFIDGIAYMADLVGIDYVGIGLDSNGEPGAYNRYDARALGDMYMDPNFDPGIYEVAFDAGRGKASMCTDGIVSLANHLNIVDKLLKRGFSKADVKKIMGENFLRVFRETWK